jgi:predicted regulator of amino acid metabolism with ACT domain
VDLRAADFNTREDMNEHETRMKITKVLIDSGLSISKQMEVLNHIKSTLKSIKIDCAPKQPKLF